MHKGTRPANLDGHYRYAADRWALAGQFWPGFIPARMWLPAVAAMHYPWDLIPGVVPQASALALVTFNRDRVTYKWASDFGSARYELELLYVPVAPGPYTQWYFQFLDDVIVYVTAVGFTPIPTRHCRLPAWSYLTSTPYPSPEYPPIPIPCPYGDE